VIAEVLAVTFFAAGLPGRAPSALSTFAKNDLARSPVSPREEPEPKPVVDDPPDVPLLIEQAALEAGIDPALATYVAWRESRFDALALSPTGDAGVFQLAPVMVRELGVRHPFDARENVSAGVGLLARYLRLARGDVERTLCLYAHPARCSGNKPEARRKEKFKAWETSTFPKILRARFHRSHISSSELAATPHRTGSWQQAYTFGGRVSATCGSGRALSSLAWSIGSRSTSKSVGDKSKPVIVEVLDFGSKKILISRSSRRLSVQRGL
jgi:hypothetical protein